MILPFAFRKSICDYLLLIPKLSDETTQQDVIKQAGIPPHLQHQIVFGCSDTQFISLLVETLGRYGKLQDGRHALEAMLETAKKFLEPEQHIAADELIRKLRGQYIEEKQQIDEQLSQLAKFRGELVSALASLLNIPENTISMVPLTKDEVQINS